MDIADWPIVASSSIATVTIVDLCINYIEDYLFDGGTNKSNKNSEANFYPPKLNKSPNQSFLNPS